MVKKAFTLAELIIMMAIIAIVITVVFITTKPFAPKFKSLYYYAFLNVRKFAGEVVASTAAPTLDSNDAKFCYDLIKDLNTVGGVNGCSAFYSGTKDSPFSGMSVSDLDRPSFALTNGQRFYVSNRVVNPADPIPYRVISVDLNGQSRPNKFDEDVVPFVVFDTGEVNPVGAPSENTDYLKVFVRAHRSDTGQASGDYIKNAADEKFLSYKEGFCLAGYNSANPNYCIAYTLNPACNPVDKSRFCKVNLIKPIIKIKI